ncbi:phage tail tape measure protein [Solimicrobium silvestre]|uniref:Phage tail tape measure protein, TP901 family, core region n=1 Tax=Solimicrobium silvestre TaxID=2099400 RepID=A0A2S9GTE6_9BURK|nr:phage tail tape measure protein [Solimicrobium silvestre]PRC90983.1 Phage tail tape measure protein, TP901 family, core region [Solimicrobium silvestre]
MADLKLQVILSALDRITAPLKAIRGAAAPTSDAIKATSDRLKDLNAQQDKISQFRELKKGLNTTSIELRAAKQRVSELGTQLTTLKSQSSPAAGAVKKLSSEYKKAQASVEKLTTTYRTNLETNKTVRNALLATGISTKKLGEAQTWLKNSIAYTNAELTSQKKKLADVATQQTRVAAMRAKYAKTKDMAGKAAMVGATSAAIGGGVLMGARQMLTPGIEFNEAMSRVQALSRVDKKSDDFKAMRQQARDLGANTSYTATEAAQGQGYLAMAGFKPADILQSMPGVLSMAKAGGSDLARAADISSDILTSFGLQADQMTRVGDVLTMTFTTANTDLEMLGDTMKYVGPIARAAGMSLEQASAMAGLLGNAGIKSSQAGTTLRSMLLRLAAPTSAAGKALKELSVSSQDLKGNVRDIPSILRDVAKATEKMGSGQRLGFLKRIFGEEPAAGMAELIDKQGADGIGRYVAIVENSKGVAAKTAQVMADNLSGDLKTLSSSWENLGITMSDAIDVPMRKVTDRITDILRVTDKWMKDNPKLAETLLMITLAVGAVLLVLGTLTIALAAIVVPMAAVSTAFGVLGITAGIALAPLLLIIAGIAVFAGLAYLVYQYWEPLKAWFTGFWEGLSDGLAPLGELFSRAFGAMGTVLEPLKPLWDWFVEKFNEAGKWLSELISPLQSTQAELDATTGSGYLFGKWIAGLILLMADVGISIITGMFKSLLTVNAFILNWSPLGIVYKAIAGILRLFGVDMPEQFSEFGSNMIASFIKGIRAQFPMLDALISKFENILPTGKLAIDSKPLSSEQVQQSQQMMDALKLKRPIAPVSNFSEVGGMANHLTQAGAGIRANLTAMPALSFDTRPPVATRPPGSSVMMQGDTNHFTINPAPGMDEAAIAKAVTKALEKQSHQKAARLRSRLAD